MDSLFQKLMLSGSAAALIAVSAGAASAQNQDSTDIEQVVVSASRITIAGYTQPTPVTVIGAAQLESSAYNDIGDSIRQMPTMGAAASAGNGINSGQVANGSAGTSTINLRNLGVVRTLVLFDGQRVVQSNTTGGVDLTTIPTTLVDRVDVVTGGASAAWGSDAVAGVVNLILNKNFTGFKANLEAGDNQGDTYRTFKGEGTWGMDFDGGRGHIILSGAVVDDPDTVYFDQVPWVKSTYLVTNPAYAAGNGQPQLIHVNNVGEATETPGGVIVSNPTGSVPGSANVLRGIQFVGAGSTAPINFGNISSTLAYGGNINYLTSDFPIQEMADPIKTETFFGYGRYRLSDSITASIQFNYGHATSVSSGTFTESPGTLVINANNAYLPASVSSVMAANGITSFNMGSTNINDMNINNPSPSASLNTVGIPINDTYRSLMRGVFTLDGALGNDWGWNVYYQHGETRVDLRVVNDQNESNFANAVNAVMVTAANRGTSGLAIGSIACVSTLTNPTNGCEPLDMFGNNVASAAAIAYIQRFSNPGSHPYNGEDWENITLNEDVASASMQGTLPWGLPAGRVAVAFGAEYRKEGGVTVVDPAQTTITWGQGNFRNFAGQYEVAEGFLEVDAPLIKNDFVESLDFNGAGRMTSYSTSGLVETWKLGLTSQVTDDFKLRTTWSYDIRAPNLAELFTSSTINVGTEIDPKTGKSVNAYSDAIGNPNLTPEAAATISAGVVMTPTFLPGLSASLDWYSIDIKGYVYTLGAANEVGQCAANPASQYCANLYYQGQNTNIPLLTPSSYPGALATVVSAPENAASLTTSGVDFQADYQMDLFSGNLAWHFVGTYTDEMTLNAPGVYFDEAGSEGGNSLVSGVPKFRGTLSATYTEGPWSGTVQTRMQGAAVLNNAWTSGVQVDHNYVPFNALLDFRGSYRWTDNIQFYGAVDNVLDTPPPSIPDAFVKG